MKRLKNNNSNQHVQPKHSCREWKWSNQHVFSQTAVTVWHIVLVWVNTSPASINKTATKITLSIYRTFHFPNNQHSQSRIRPVQENNSFGKLELQSLQKRRLLPSLIYTKARIILGGFQSTFWHQVWLRNTFYLNSPCEITSHPKTSPKPQHSSRWIRKDLTQKAALSTKLRMAYCIIRPLREPGERRSLHRNVSQSQNSDLTYLPAVAAVVAINESSHRLICWSCLYLEWGSM